MAISNLNTNKLLPRYVNNGLVGVGNWAEISAMTGSPTRLDYSAGGVDWSAFRWTSSGSVTTTAGVVDALVVGGGGAGQSGGGFVSGGGGGDVRQGIFSATASVHTIQVGAVGGSSQLGSIVRSGPGTTGTYSSIKPPNDNQSSAGSASIGGTGATVWGIGTSSNVGGGAGGTLYGSASTDGITSSITGSSVEYGEGGYSGVPAVYGNGGYTTAQPGVVIIRVPAANVTASSGWV